MRIIQLQRRISRSGLLENNRDSLDRLPDIASVGQGHQSVERAPYRPLSRGQIKKQRKNSGSSYGRGPAAPGAHG